MMTPQSNKPRFTILVCGCRDWHLGWPIRNLLESMAERYDLRIVEGGARGADKLAGNIAKELLRDGKLREHLPMPADWDGPHKKQAGILRNLDMLKVLEEAQAAGEKVGVAAFKENLDVEAIFKVKKGGTEHTLREARKRGFTISWHNGKAWQEIVDPAASDEAK